MDWLTGFAAGAGGDGPAALTITGALAVIIVALRRRRDVDVVEMGKRIGTLEARVATLETEREEDREELAKVRALLVERDRQVFVLRSTLAKHGHPDPTALEAS